MESVSLISMDLEFRYSVMMMAMARDASAAAMAIQKIAKNKPSRFSGNKNLLNATKFMLTLFKINSTDMRSVIIFLLVRNP